MSAREQVPTIQERLRGWAQNEEMIDSDFLPHGRDCNEAAAVIDDLLAALEDIEEVASVHAGGRDWGGSDPAEVFGRALEAIENAAREAIKRARGEASV